jgi:predicted nucleic acid-binding protein
LKTVVLDASVMVACLFKDGRARHVLLHAPTVTFLAPPGVIEEALAQLPRIAKRIGLPEQDIRLILADLLRSIEVVPIARIEPFERAARAIAGGAGAEDDWEYVALCLAENAPVWTYDADFPRMKGVKLISTSQVLSWGSGTS